MNKINELRRQLILRLIVFENELYGQLEMVEALLLGRLTTAQASAWLGSLDVGTLSAVAKISIQFSKYCQTWLNIGGVGVQSTTTKLPSDPLELIFDIGGLSGIKIPNLRTPSTRQGILDIGGVGVVGNARRDNVKALAISVKETSLYFQGRALVQPYGIPMYGELKVCPKTWQGILSCNNIPEHLFGVFEEGNNLIFTTPISLRENPHGLISSLIVGNCIASGGPRLKQGYGIGKELGFSCEMDGVGFAILRAEHPFGELAQYNLFSKTLISVASDVKHLYGAPIVIEGGAWGYIDVTITKAVVGKIGFDYFIQGKCFTRFGDEIKGIMASSQGGVKMITQAGVKNAKRALSILNIPSKSVIIAPELIPSLSVKTKSMIGGLEYKNIIRTRYGEALMVPGPLIPFTDGMGVESIVSYQKRDSIYGSMPVKAKTAIEPTIDSVIVLTYQIIHDDEDGEIYEIQTKYHKDNEGVALMGWRYFNELIE